MILLQSVERILQRARHRGDLGEFLRTQIVDVLVERLPRIDLVLDADIAHGKLRDSGRALAGEPQPGVPAQRFVVTSAGAAVLLGGLVPQTDALALLGGYVLAGAIT